MEEEETLLDVQHSPLFKLKRKVLIMALFFNFFLVGLEYSVTIPAAFFNGKYSSADRQFMLLEVGFYPLAAMVSSLIVGHAYDRTKKIRNYMIFMNLLQVVGNFIYAIDYSRWLPLIGRLISGAGDGFIAIAIAEITYLYEEHNRVGMLCILELGRVLGFLMGPIVNFFIDQWSLHHKWTLHNKVLPSYIMGCCWTAMFVITVCCVQSLALEIIEKFNLNDSPFLSKKTLVFNAKKGIYENPEETEDDEKESDEEEVIYENVDNPFVDPALDEALMEQQNGGSNSKGDNSEEEPLLEKSEERIEDESKNDYEESASKIFPIPKKNRRRTIGERVRLFARSKIDNTKNRMSTKVKDVKSRMSDNASDALHRSHLGAVISLEFGLLLVINFVFWYSQTSFLMFCSYITTYEYHWTPIEIGFTYVIGFALIIAIFVIMYFLRAGLLKKNIYFLIVAMAFIQISLGLLIYESVPADLTKRIIVFVVAALLVFLSTPFSLVCYKTLLTSLVRPGLQGTLQGVSSAVVRLAMISGLLLSVVSVLNRQLYGSIMTAVCFVSIIMFFLTFDNITRKQRESAMSSSF